jgi:2-polyprenyl-3-methyl-5-hydroxy-6-metoxy-1,4-benzoquinol methylase
MINKTIQAIKGNFFCRHCNSEQAVPFIDLGFAPPSNAYLTKEKLKEPEIYYPLRVNVCKLCWLVQTEDYAKSNELFTDDYAYFSSTSISWLEHSKKFANSIVERLKLNSESLVIEVGSNDGYLLQNFLKLSINCLGIEPTIETAKAAKLLGIKVVEDFFTESLAEKLINDVGKADLIIGNNVFAHVPDINNFTRGVKKLLKSEGVITFEFPHILNMIELSQFDTIYHEHFSYFSLHAAMNVFTSFGLKIFDVEKLSTHGGSLRIYGCHKESQRDILATVDAILKEELLKNITNEKGYINFQEKSDTIKNQLLYFLLKIKKNSNTVAAYGAAAKGNTILNFAGVKPDLLPVIYDAAPSKQGKFMPGSHIPIEHPNQLMHQPPDYVIVLPWNIGNEISNQLSEIKKRGSKIVSFIPEIKYL